MTVTAITFGLLAWTVLCVAIGFVTGRSIGIRQTDKRWSQEGHIEPQLPKFRVK